MGLLEYEYRDTPWHKMHPGTKAVLFFSINNVTGLLLDWKWKFPIFLLMMLFMYKAKLPKSCWQFLGVGFFLSNVLLRIPWTIFYANPNFFKVLDPEFVSKVIFEITPVGFPLIGRTAITWGTVYYSLCGMFNQPIVMGSAFIFISTTSPSEIMHSLYKLRIPDPLIFSFITAWSFFPILLNNSNIILNAQRLRGWRLKKTRNPIDVAKNAFPFVYPVTRSVIPIYNDLTLAVKTRGFNSAKIDPKPMSLSTNDRLLIIICFIINIVIIYGVYTRNWGLI